MIAGMKTYGFFLPGILALFLTAFTLQAQTASPTPAPNAEQDLSSPEGLMRLVPQLKGADGKFEIPNPKKDLPQFLAVHQALLNVIETVLTQAMTHADPYAVASIPWTPLTFSSNWRAAEVGFATDATHIPNFSKGGFAYYGGNSFLQGIIPVAGTNNSFYTVPGSVVYISPMPTLVKNVNRLMETSGLNAGTMIATSYILGDKDGKAWLIINGCQNSARLTKVSGTPVMAPGASSFLGIQWADTPEMAYLLK
jgi:hypothetical protein